MTAIKFVFFGELKPGDKFSSSIYSQWTQGFEIQTFVKGEGRYAQCLNDEYSQEFVYNDVVELI